MDILYKQPDTLVYPNAQALPVSLCHFGISHCFLKRLTAAQDARRETRKPHHHTGFEIHIVLRGCQTYLARGERFAVQAGHYLVFPPLFQHQIVASEPDTLKQTVTFAAEDSSALLLPLRGSCLCAELPASVDTLLSLISCEAERPRELSPFLIGNHVLALLLAISRAAGYPERTLHPRSSGDDPRLALARQYIRDNIEEHPTCAEVAAYCHLSEKQLTRLFQQTDGLTLGAFIQRQKVARIERLLTETNLPLRRIAERLHFSSEYYFNAYFKQYAGITPGAYRKMYCAPQQG